MCPSDPQPRRAGRTHPRRDAAAPGAQCVARQPRSGHGHARRTRRNRPPDGAGAPHTAAAGHRAGRIAPDLWCEVVMSLHMAKRGRPAPHLSSRLTRHLSSRPAFHLSSRIALHLSSRPPSRDPVLGGADGPRIKSGVTVLVPVMPVLVPVMPVLVPVMPILASDTTVCSSAVALLASRVTVDFLETPFC
jgi:hypothetical protein